MSVYTSSLVDLDIKKFLQYYRESFPRSTFPKASVLPKMHLLEDHMVDWLRKYHLAAGFMGEQGAESIHAHINRLEEKYQGVQNKVAKLKYIYEMYTLETAPSLQTLKPKVKTRKRRRPTDS